RRRRPDGLDGRPRRGQRRPGRTGKFVVGDGRLDGRQVEAVPVGEVAGQDLALVLNGDLVDGGEQAGLLEEVVRELEGQEGVDASLRVVLDAAGPPLQAVVDEAAGDPGQAEQDLGE